MPEEKKEEAQVPEKFKELVEKIEKMSVLDLAELVKILEKKFGVSAVPTAPVGTVATKGMVGAGDAQAEEKTAFNLVLKSAGGQKIAVIKVIREITGKGLKEAKDMTDKSPITLKENVPTKDAEEMKKKLETAGAVVELK